MPHLYPRRVEEEEEELEISEDSYILLTSEEEIWTIHFRPKFVDLLGNETLMDSFRCYLESALSGELLEFYLDCEAYVAMDSIEERSKMLQKIVSNYFNNASEKAINLNATCYRHVQNTKPTEQALAFPMQQARSLMIRDSLPKYYRSPFYYDFLQGRRDTRKEAFSRKKATDFFGELIVGPLCRVESEFGEERSAVLVITERQKKVHGKGSKLFGVLSR